jgi:hypothetical protein
MSYAYEFPVQNLENVIVHASAIGVDVISMTLNGGIYVIVTANKFPDEQLAHLEMIEV